MSADESNKTQKKYIVPPGLIARFYSMAAHYSAAKGEPVMIVGDTGVGKTMFLLIYEYLYKLENKGKGHPIIKANCAHFGGKRSDSNIARTELFGLDASGIWGTRNDVVGLVERANGGLLILEEIGELPLEVQSMLLTFVETGEYRRVGDTEPEPRKSNIRIIGATNRENALRKDFRYRFFPFNVPPIYERRVDVLYYLANRFPELIESLSPMETFALLAHHWPGSVREIERVGSLIQRKMELIKPDFMKTMFKLPPGSTIANVNFVNPARLLQLERHDTSLDVTEVVDLYDRMKERGVNVKALELVLNHFNIGLNVRSENRFFSTFKKLATVPEMSPTDDTSIVISKSYDPFEKALRGYSLFCSIFFQKPEGEKGNFNVSTPSTIEFYINLEKLPPVLRKKCQTVMKEVFEFLSGIRLPKGVNIPEIYPEREIFFENIIKQYPDNEFLTAISKLIPFKAIHDTSNTVDIFSMKYTDFKKYYYEGLESRWGTLRKAAKIIGEKESTVYGRRAESRKDSLIK